MKCFVSGATGFIGRQLCHQLEVQGDTVVALSKSGAPLNSGAPTVGFDLAHKDPEENMLQGVEVVFHLAGVAHQRAPDSAYPALNCDATLRLARMASSAGARCFIFMSSVKAMGPVSEPVARGENDCVMPADAYGLSKWQAECALREEFMNDSMSIVIVRPALVYGACVKGSLRQLALAVRMGLPRPPAGGCRSMISLEDLSDLLCVIARAPLSGIRTWIACGADSYSTQNIYDLLRDASGKDKGLAWLPAWGWQLGTWLLDFAAPQSAESFHDKIFGTELYSSAALLAATTWRPKVRLEDVIGQLVSTRRPRR
ncbi:MAG: NAD-dependent epimerase/dehydratase family protein [Halioglobus sp.]|nr:NAD-dependent epimerase/dehydratase family protein [Halioglobus sp.]